VVYWFIASPAFRRQEREVRMSDSTIEAASARVVAVAREAVGTDGISDAAAGKIKEALRELAATPALLEQVDMHRLHDSGAAATLLASEGPEGITLVLARFASDAPTPVHDHGTWGVACVVAGEDRYVHWERLDSGQDADHAQVRVHYERLLGPGETVDWQDPPHDIHSQQGSGGDVWELVLFGRNALQHPRHYFDPETGSVRTARPV
jgi:predicted metal-dependent enzyme (double-stranded beta helix superfamily)